MRIVVRLVCGLVACLVVIVLSGCATSKLYSGPRLASDQVAYLERGDLSQILQSIDEHKSGNFFVWNRALEIMPGEHTVSIGYSSGNLRSTQNVTLTFTAKPGTRYVVRSNAFGNQWRPSIVEKGGRSVSRSTNAPDAPPEGLLGEVAHATVLCMEHAQSQGFESSDEQSAYASKIVALLMEFDPRDNSGWASGFAMDKLPTVLSNMTVLVHQAKKDAQAKGVKQANADVLEAALSKVKTTITRNPATGKISSVVALDAKPVQP